MVEREELLAAAEQRVGRTVNSKFKLVRLLGVGGMAAVYEACHRNGKRVALKLLHPALSLSERQRTRLLREAHVANTIGHPGVVQIHDDGVDADGTAYLVMELLEGETVGALAKQAGGCLPVARVLDIADQLLDVLCAAHARGVVHRDIKPENVFMTTSGHVKVLDFGIARFFDPVPGAAVHTQDGSMLGTPAFMAQEQARGRWNEVDQRSDLWAVGATLFTLVTGEFVHAAETPNEQLGKAMTMTARSLAELHPQLPAAFTAAVDRSLRFERAQRWRDATSMRQALRQAWDEPVLSAKSERPSAPAAALGVVTESLSLPALTTIDRRTRHKRWLGWALAGAVVASASASVAMSDSRRERVLGRSAHTDAPHSPPVRQPLLSAVTPSDPMPNPQLSSTTLGPKISTPRGQASHARDPVSARGSDSSHKRGTSHVAALPPDPLDRRH